MKFKVIKSSDHHFVKKEDQILEMNSLEELLEFVKKAGTGVIVGEPFYEDQPFVLEIYDDYRE